MAEFQKGYHSDRELSDSERRRQLYIEKLKSFRAMITDRLWQFMRNSRQPWIQDVLAFLCTGRVEVVKTRWHLCW